LGLVTQAVRKAGSMVQAVEATTTPAPVREHTTMKSLLEAGVHFGHQTRRWNPQMKRYIFMHRNGIHIIDLQQTLVMLENACRGITQIVADGGDVLFVGTKKQAQEAIQTEATRCGMPYVNQRWLGGTLTNFQTIRSRVDHMAQLEEKREKAYPTAFTKKESLKLDEELARLHKYFTGIRDMKKLPSALFVIDLEKEDICIAEVRRLGIHVAAVVDSNCDPNLVTMPIPGNDDAIRSIRLMASRMADAVLEGLELRAELPEEPEELEEESEASEIPQGLRPVERGDYFTTSEDAHFLEEGGFSDTLTESAPVDTAPVDTTPVDTDPVDAAPADAAPADSATVDTASVDETSTSDEPAEEAEPAPEKDTEEEEAEIPEAELASSDPESLETREDAV
jgi:small subunit ribosomal protein S2